MPPPILIPIALGGLFGALVGSFVATLVLRWPAGVAVTHGRSRCDHCRTPLPPMALVPLASFLWLRGRCRRCGGAIDKHHPLVELAGALIGALALARSPDMAGIAGAAFGWTLLALALLDAEHLWLPDRLVWPLTVAGGATGLCGLPPMPADRAMGCGAGFLLLELMRRGYRRARGREGLGQADPKLFAAIGAWLGWQALPAVLLGAALLGIAWALLPALAGRAIDPARRLPFGTMLALAAWATWLAAAAPDG